MNEGWTSDRHVLDLTTVTATRRFHHKLLDDRVFPVDDQNIYQKEALHGPFPDGPNAPNIGANLLDGSESHCGGDAR